VCDSIVTIHVASTKTCMVDDAKNHMVLLYSRTRALWIPAETISCGVLLKIVLQTKGRPCLNTAISGGILCATNREKEQRNKKADSSREPL
jgi:hypothetical protein